MINKPEEAVSESGNGRAKTNDQTTERSSSAFVTAQLIDNRAASIVQIVFFFIFLLPIGRQFGEKLLWVVQKVSGTNSAKAIITSR